MVLPSPARGARRSSSKEARQTPLARGWQVSTKGALQMRGLCLAQWAGVLLLAGSSTAFAQCDSKESEKLCVDGGKIATYKYDIVDEKNMAGTTELKQLDDQCLEARTIGHAKEASRTPNGWLCQAAERTIQIHISYCQ
jgi:hypothetical protein